MLSTIHHQAVKLSVWAQDYWDTFQKTLAVGLPYSHLWLEALLFRQPPPAAEGREAVVAGGRTWKQHGLGNAMLTLLMNSTGLPAGAKPVLCTNICRI